MASLAPIGLVVDVLNRLDVSVSECNGNYQHAVVDAILATGKHVDDLTIREVREIQEQVSHKLYGKGRSYVA